MKQTELFSDGIHSICQVIIINNRLGMVGNDMILVNEDFYGLKVDTIVYRIGDGKENGTVRTDNYPEGIKYVGSIVCEFSIQEKMFAFELPEKTTDGKKLYYLYGTTGKEIFTEALSGKKGRMRFYSPVFKTCWEV